MNHERLVGWIVHELEMRNLSQSEASRRAGLGPNAISEIVNGRTPGLRVCKALADFFSVSPEHVLRLAGHLPPNLSPARQREFERVAELLASTPDGSVRREAMAAIVAIAESAKRRALEQEERTGEP